MRYDLNSGPFTGKTILECLCTAVVAQLRKSGATDIAYTDPHDWENLVLSLMYAHRPGWTIEMRGNEACIVYPVAGRTVRLLADPELERAIEFRLPTTRGDQSCD